jgi:hypothetical protein
MIQGCRRAGFQFESAQPIFVLRRGRMNEFEGNIASEPLVPRTVHISHAAGADPLQDPIVTQDLPSHAGGSFLAQEC